MSTFTLSGNEEQTLLISAVRYALGRSTYMPSFTCSVLTKHMGSLEPATAAIIARDIRNHWDSYEGPNSMEKFRTPGSYYNMDVRCFTDLLPKLDERSKECNGYPMYIPYLPTGYNKWEDVPEEIRYKEVSNGENEGGQKTYDI